MTSSPTHGEVIHEHSERKPDYLYRVSLKCLIRNEYNEVLVVKEAGRASWDLPGGGMNHSENIQAAIAREMYEEVSMRGNFTFRILSVDEPMYLNEHGFWQLRLIFEVNAENMNFMAGDDGDTVTFIDPKSLRSSESDVERRVYTYSLLSDR